MLDGKKKGNNFCVIFFPQMLPLICGVETASLNEMNVLGPML